LSESDYWLSFDWASARAGKELRGTRIKALQKWGYKVDLGPIDPDLEAKMQA
jgi:hypothetical protein